MSLFNKINNKVNISIIDEIIQSNSIFRLRNMVVLNFNAIVKFIRLFENSLITLHLALIHQDPNFKHTLTYIDGNRVYNDIVIHMKLMKDFSFWIETVCLCNQQMNNIIHSFQTGLTKLLSDD